MKCMSCSGVRLSTLAGVVLGLVLLGACAEMMDKQGQSMDGEVDAMKSMAMDNMKEVMMMQPQERKQYVMKVQRQAISHGEELFADSGLGTNGFSCATCHPRGDTTGGKVPMGEMQVEIPSLHGAAATFPKYKVPNDGTITLAEMNNNCIVMFMDGQPLPLGGNEARNLAAYVTSLSQGNRLEPGRQAM